MVALPNAGDTATGFLAFLSCGTNSLNSFGSSSSEYSLSGQLTAEVDASDAAVAVDGHAEGLDVVGAVGALGEIGEVELDLVPPLVELHGHGADEGLDLGGGLVVGGAEAAFDALVVEHLDLEGEILLEVLDDHDEEGQFDGQLLVLGLRRRDEGGGHVGPDDLQDAGVDVVVRQPFDVPVFDVLLPNLQRLRPDRVEDRKEPRLVRVLEH